MKKILFIILILPVIVQAVDTELQDLAAMTAIISTDVLYIVDDPGGTPLSRKITALDLFDMIDTFAELNAITADETLVSEEGTPTLDALWTFDLGITITTGDPFILGVIRWDNGSDLMDGEQIAADTIDNDSIDWGDMTDLTTDGALDVDVVDEAHIADNGIDSEHYNDGSIDLIHIAAAAYAVDLVTTAPVTGATDNIMMGADADVTIALDFTAAWNFGGAAGSEWVNDAAPTTDAAGEIALDTTIADHQPLWQYYDGGENMTIIAIDTAQLPALDNEIVKYDAGADKFVLEADAGGGGNDVYVEEGDAARVDTTGADLYIDFDDTDFGVGVVGNEGNITITDDGHAHTGASVTGIDAITGDSATAFFDAGTIEHEWGGLQANLAAYTGLIGITGADTTVEVDTSAEMATAITDETGSGKLTFATAPVFVTSIQLTGADADPAAAAGTIAYDSTIAVLSGGALRWYDNDSVRVIVDLETDPVDGDDDKVIAYDSGADGFYMKADADTGGFTAWDDIGDPDAAATVDFTTYTQTLDIGKSDSGGGNGLVLDVTGLGAGTDDVVALLITTVTNGDADFIPIEIRDDSGTGNDLLFYVNSEGKVSAVGGISFSDAAKIDQSQGDSHLTFAEAGDYIDFYYGGTDLDIVWSDGALNLRNNEDGTDAIVEIEGKDAGEKGILRVLSDGDDKYIEFYHDDTDAHIISSSGDMHIEAVGGGINFANDNLVTTGAVDFGGAASVEITNSADPDVDAVGEISADTDGANETGDSSLRGYDGAAQFLYSKKIKHITFSIVNPDQIEVWTGRINPSQPIWFNTTGMTFTITEVYAISDTDNYDFTLFESNTATDMSDDNDASIIAIQCDADGTECFTDTEAAIGHAVEADHAIIFEDTLGSAKGVLVTISGWFNSNID